MVAGAEYRGGHGERSAFAAKDVVVAVGSNFTTLDPYDANDTLSQAVAKFLSRPVRP